MKMAVGLKSGFKNEIRFWMHQHLVTCSEVVKIKRNLSICVGASVAAVERGLHYHKYHKGKQKCHVTQLRSTCVNGLSLKKGECSFLIPGNVACFLHHLLSL